LGFCHVCFNSLAGFLWPAFFFSFSFLQHNPNFEHVFRTQTVSMSWQDRLDFCASLA